MALTTVYLIRHGQAGSRQVYDCLSDVGRQQSRRLGAWFRGSGVRFDAAWSGRLTRQRETAETVRESCLLEGGNFPEIAVDSCWDEFDLDAVYQSIGPQIARKDAEFSRQFEELQRQTLDAGSPVHRNWTKCDTTVVRAWVGGEYEFAGESFSGFVTRVRGGGEGLFESLEAGGNIAVFTSATPAAIWVAAALGIDGRQIMRLAGVTYNTAMTVVRMDGNKIWLVQFNSVPHVDLPELLTLR